MHRLTILKDSEFAVGIVLYRGYHLETDDWNVEYEIPKKALILALHLGPYKIEYMIG